MELPDDLRRIARYEVGEAVEGIHGKTDGDNVLVAADDVAQHGDRRLEHMACNGCTVGGENDERPQSVLAYGGTDEGNGVRFNGLDAKTPFGDGLFQVKDQSNPMNPSGEDFFFTTFIDPVSGKLIAYGIGADDEGKPFNVLLFQK